VRSVQRIRHQRQPGPRARTHIRKSEAKALSRKKRVIWKRRLRRTLILLPIVSAATAVALFLHRPRIVADGLVRADQVVARAPAAVRVRAIHVEPGQRLRRGDLLAELEPVDEGLLAEARSRVDEKRLRLQLAESGAEVGLTTELGRRGDLVAGATLEAGLAEAELGVVEAQLETLARERDALAYSLQEEALRSAGEVTDREASTADADLGLEAARNALRLAETDADNQVELHADGITSFRDRLAAYTERNRIDLESVQARNAADAARRELETARRIDEVVRLRNAAKLREIDARIETVRREAESVRKRRDLWAGLAEQRQSLLPSDPSSGEELHALEVELLRAELQTAEARLEAEARRLGATDVRAQCDGIVDRIEVRPGAVVEPGAELVHYYDPATIRVVAYVAPADVDRVAVGASCRLVLRGRREVVEARVGAIGASLVPLPAEADSESDRRDIALALPVSVGDMDASGSFLRPNMRVKVVIPAADTARAEEAGS